MTKVPFGKKTIPALEKPIAWYSILIDEVAFMSGHILCEYYGVRIDMDGQSAEVRHVTTNQGSIISLMEALKTRMVTPPGLREAVDGWLACS